MAYELLSQRRKPNKLEGVLMKAKGRGEWQGVKNILKKNKREDAY